MISDVDWPELFERISLVDDVLAAGSAFRDMDFPTRNLYRSAIEELSRGADRTELDVARAAVQAAKRGGMLARERRGRLRHKDPGYHLLAGGRRAFEAAIGFRPPPACLARTPEPEARHRRLRRRRRHCCRGHPRHAAVRAARPGSRPDVARPARSPGCGARHRRGGGGGEPLCDARLRRNAVAGSGTSQRRASAICARSSPCRRC